MEIVTIIAGICVGIFILQLSFNGFTELFLLTPALLESKPWTIFTNIFLHGSLIHLLYNLLGLWVFGSILEREVGRVFFLLTFVLSGLFGAFGYVFLTQNPIIGALGASGAVFGLIGAVTILLPNMVIYTLYGPMPMKLAGPLWAIIELVAMGRPDNIAHSAHLAGLIGGVLLAVGWRKELIEITEKNALFICAGLVACAILISPMLVPYGDVYIQMSECLKEKTIDSNAIICLFNLAEEMRKTDPEKAKIVCKEVKNLLLKVDKEIASEMEKECLKGK